MNRNSIILESGELRSRTSNDTLCVGCECDYVNTAVLQVTGTENSTVDNFVYDREGVYNGYASYKNHDFGIYLFYTGDFWAIHTSKTSNYVECLYTSPTQVGIYKDAYGGEALVDRDETPDQTLTSNGLLNTTYLTVDTLTLNQARLFFDSSSNSNRLDILSDGNVALLLQSNNNNILAIPTGNRDDWAIQTFQSVLVGTNSTNVSDTSFDDTFLTDTFLGVTEWIYTSNFRTEGNHYTNNLTDDDSLEIAGIEHNTYLGLNVNTPENRPHWGDNGQAAFDTNLRKLSIRYNPNPPSYPEAPDWRLSNTYDEYMNFMDKHKNYYISHRQTPSSLTETAHPDTSGSVNFQYYSCVSQEDGSVAYIQYNQPNHLICDSDGSLSFTSNGNGSSYDLAYCPYDKRIYEAPFSFREFRSWDLSSNDTNTHSVASANWTIYGFQPLAVAEDGTLHAPPLGNENEVIKLDPTTNTVSYYGTATTSNVTYTFTKGALMGDGCIWLPPAGALNGDLTMRKVDPVNETVTDYSLGLSATTMNHGKIFAIPYKEYMVWFQQDNQDRGFYKYNIETNTATRIGPAIATGYSFRTAFLAPDGCIYAAAPETGIYRVDVENNTWDLIYSDANTYEVIGLSSSGKVFLCDTTYKTGGYFSPIQSFDLFDVPIDPNFLCNRYLNTS